MSLNLTYADNADRALKRRRRNAAKIVTAVLFLMLLAATLGFVSPDPIHTYW